MTPVTHVNHNTATHFTPPCTGDRCKPSAAEAAKGNDMAQNDMPKGCCKQRFMTVKDTSVKNKATPASMCTSTSGAPNWWPDKANTLPAQPIPIAYTFASFDGELLIPNWITRLGGLQILFNNKPGCTYITSITLTYDTPAGKQSQQFSLSGGLSKTVGNIPLNATNISAQVKFKGMINSDNYSFNWPSPLGQWLTGSREIQMNGVWPGKTSATDLQH